MLKTRLPIQQKKLWTVETKLKKPLPTSEYVANFLWRVVHINKVLHMIFFLYPIKTGASAFQQIHLSQNSGTFSHVYKQKPCQKNVLVSTTLKKQIFYRGRKVRRKSNVIQLIVVAMNCARSHRRKSWPIPLVLFWKEFSGTHV